ncbi:MAG: hypothetical protein PHP98_09280 [Kiritimatiellae bacterium]|nr:hypothetical protein [Kiritimatiellia bacterium]
MKKYDTAAALTIVLTGFIMAHGLNAFGGDKPDAPADKAIPAGKIEFKDMRVFTLENPIIGIPVLPRDNLVPAAVFQSETGPTDDERTSELRVIAARGEYESASLVIRPLKDVSGLILEADDFRKEDGENIIPADEIDIRAVKCWHQAGAAWTGISGSRTISKLTPELLLKNDALVRVDEAGTNDYIVLQFPGEKKEVCITDPDAKISADPGEFPVRDAKLLMPLDLKAGINKQYWITIRVPEAAPAGFYTARVTIKSAAGPLGEIALKLRVLPFSLPLPKTWHDPARDFVSSLYYRGQLSDSYPDGAVSSEWKSEEQLRAELRDMRAHNVFNPACYQKIRALGTYLRIRNELGMAGLPLYWIWGVSIDNPQDAAGLERIRKNVRLGRSIAALYGISDVYFYGIDEAKDEKLLSQRPAWKAVHEAGGKMFVAGYKGHFEKVGDLLDLLVMAFKPLKDEAKKWHSAGHQIFCYANPQSGPENPELFRRNFGLYLWKTEYDGACTYAYQGEAGPHIWNDFDKKTRAHIFSYPTIDGVIPTLAFEGYREGIDDIRYGTLLRSLISKNKGWFGQKAKIAKAAENYLETLDTRRDLGVIRLEIIEYILKLAD